MSTIEITKRFVSGNESIVTVDRVDFDVLADSLSDEDYALAGGAEITPKSLCKFLSGTHGSADCFTDVFARVL